MTAKEIQEQTRRIEEFTRAKVELGRVEKDYQRTLGESYRLKKSTKKIDDALEAAASNLEQRERRAISTTNKYNTELEYRQELNKRYGSFLGNIERQLKTVKTTEEKGVKRQQELNKKKKYYTALIDKNRKYMVGYKKALKQEGASLETVRDKYAQVEKLRASYTALPMVSVKNEKEFESAIKQRMDAEEEYYGKLADLIGLTGQERNDYIASMRAGNREEEISNKLLTGQSKELQAQIKDRAHIAKLIKEGRFEDVKKEVRGEIGNVKGQMGKVWSSKGVGGTAEAAKGAYGGISKSLDRIKMMREEMAKVGGTAKGFAGTMQLLGQAFSVIGKMNWIALIITAVTVVGKTLNEFDKFIKEYNKDFAKMYGPTIAIKNVRKSMKEFTDAVFNMNRNLKYGLSSKEIMGMFEALTAGGMSLRGVGQRITGGYNEAIEEATKLSYDFGVSMEEMGSMIGSQMVDLRSTIGDASEAMQRMAYDASIAGIKSQKFYEATYAAADALSYYGNYLSSASAMLKTFAKAGAMGFKDASKEAQEFMGLFEKMGSTQRMGFITVVGEEKVRKDLSTKAQQLSQEEGLLDTDIGNMKRQVLSEKDSARREELQRQIAAKEEEKATKTRGRIMAEAGAKGTVMAMQTALPLLADRTAEYTITALENAGADIFDPESILRASKQLAIQTGMTEDTVTKFAYTMMASMEDAKKTATYLSDSFKNMGQETKKNLVGVMDKYIADIEAGRTVDMGMLETDIGPYADQLGMTVEEFTKEFGENAWLLRDALKGIDPKNMDYRRLSLKPMQNLLKATGGKGAMRDKRIDEMVKHTRTWEEFAGIGKENAKYLASMLGDGNLQEMANQAAIAGTKGIFSILGFLEKGGKKGGWKSEEEFRKSPEWDALVKTGERVAMASQALSDAEEETRVATEKLAQAEQAAKKEGTPEEKDAAAKAVLKAKEDLDVAKAAAADAKKALDKEKDIQSKIKTSRPDLENQAYSQGIEQGSKNYQKLLKYRAALIKAEEANDANKAKIFKDLIFKLEDPRAYKQREEWVDKFYPRAKGEEREPGRQRWEELGRPMAEVQPAGTTKPKKINDGLVLKGGLLDAATGDFFTQNRDIAKTVSAGAGQLMGKALTDTMPSGGAQRPVVIDFDVNLGTFIGDANDLAKVLKPAMEQSFLRMYKEMGKRA